MKKRKNDKTCENTESNRKKYYFYTDEFLKWFERHKSKGFPALNGKFTERWKYILQFDSLEINEPIDTIEKTNRRIISDINDNFLKGCSDDIF